MRRAIISIVIIALLISSFILVSNSEAVPTYARKYKTSCSTCHYAFPRLNSFGKAFQNNGLRYPGDDKDFAKEDPMSLGAESQKKVFPDAIWPSDIPGMTSISFRWISRTHYQPSKTGEEFTFENPHELEAFMTGTIGEDFSYFFDLEWEHIGEFVYGGNLDFKLSDRFHVRLGNIDYLPVMDHQRLTVEHYNYGSFRKLDASGIEFWGAANGSGDKGGLLYSVGFFNGENDGDVNVDLNSQKDVFAKASYKVGGMGVLGSTTASKSSAFWKDNSITIGAFGHAGSNTDHSKNRNIGVNIDYFRDDLNLFGLYMVSKSQAASSDVWVDTKRAFVEADYVVHPWLIPLVRFEYTKVDGDIYPKKLIVPAVVIMARANIKLITTARFDITEDDPITTSKNSDNNKFNFQVEVGI